MPFTAEEKAAADAEAAAFATAEVQRQAAETERAASTADLREQHAAAMARLDQITAFRSFANNAACGAATVELARIQRRTLRLLKAALT